MNTKEGASDINPRWRISHARGYLGLGLAAHALAELALLPSVLDDRDDVMMLRAAALQELREWLRLQPLARELVRRHPDDAGWWIMWAYATRRAESLRTANDILLDAESRHPGEAVIHFNLGCYACLLGDLTEAQRRVELAVSLDAGFAESSLTDPDLADLRETGWLPRGT